MKKNTKLLIIRIDPKLGTSIDEAAEKFGLPSSTFARLILKRYMESSTDEGNQESQ